MSEYSDFQECVHSQSYSYMLDSICSPDERMDILYQWKTDEHLLARNTFIGNCYNLFQEKKDAATLLKVMMANYVLEGVLFLLRIYVLLQSFKKRENAGICSGDPLHQPG